MGSATTRREFLETTTGLVIAFALPWRVQTAAGAAPFAPNAWLRIGADGIVTLTIDRSEMGQGSQTGLALILAEEREAPAARHRGRRACQPEPAPAARWPARRAGGAPRRAEGRAAQGPQGLPSGRAPGPAPRHAWRAARARPPRPACRGAGNAD